MSDAVSDQTTSHQFDKAIERERAREQPRGHLGLSRIGHEDSRTVWLEFRWSLDENFDARKLRIFQLGNLLEDEMIRVLKQVPGMLFHDIDPDTNRQWRASALGGHLQGSMDGKVQGVPEAPAKVHVFECKSAKDSEFKEAKRNGIKKWKPTYWTQVHCYMGIFELKAALYCVYNKDTSEIYWERIRFEKSVYEKAMLQAERLIGRDVPPPSDYPSKNDYRLKAFRDQQWRDIYWGKKVALPNCRNCLHSQVSLAGHAEWVCGRHGHLLSLNDQINGCSNHLYIPELLEGCATEVERLVSGGIIRYETKDGVEFWNCEDTSPYPGAMVFDSLEVCALTRNDGLNRAYLSDEGLNRLRTLVDGKLRP